MQFSNVHFEIVDSPIQNIDVPQFFNIYQRVLPHGMAISDILGWYMMIDWGNWQHILKICSTYYGKYVPNKIYSFLGNWMIWQRLPSIILRRYLRYWRFDGTTVCIYIISYGEYFHVYIDYEYGYIYMYISIKFYKYIYFD